jgi:hypothetical protein
MGQVVGITLTGTLLAGAMVTTLGHASFNALHTGDSPTQRAAVLAVFLVGMERAYVVAALICFLGLWASLVRGKPEP